MPDSTPPAETPAVPPAAPVAKEALPTHKDEYAAYRHPDDASFDKFVAAIDRAYHRPVQMMWRSFLQGVATALGATVGAGLVLIILFYVLRSINFSPYIQDFQNIVIPASIRNELNPSPTPTLIPTPIPDR